MARSERRVPLPALFGGISQQPPHLRFPNQVEDAENAEFNVADGIRKRAGTELTISPNVAVADTRSFVIDRDGVEQYLVVYGANLLRVFEVLSDNSLLEATVNITSAADTYLNLNSAGPDDLRLMNVADFTFIANTTVEVATDASDNFSITREFESREAMFSHQPTNHTYHSVDTNGDGTADEWWQFTPDEDGVTWAKWTGPTVYGSAWATSTGGYNDSAKLPMGFIVAFQRLDMDITGGTITTSTLALSKTGAFSGYTHEAGDQIYITGGTGVTAGWYNIVSRDSDDQITLATDPGGTDPTDVTTDSIGGEFEVTFDPSATKDDMEAVALEFQTQLRKAGPDDALIEWVSEGPATGHFVITSPWRGSGTTVFDPTSPSAGFDLTASGRPFHSDGSPTAGTGSATSQTQSPPSARWTQVSKPDEPDNAPDPDKMPVKMVRSSYTGDGVTAAVFDVDVIAWNERLSGDSDTNPIPSLWQDSLKIADISFHRNRLILGGGDKIVASQAGDLFNFFLQDADNIVDSDPIDLSLGGEDVTLVDFMVPFRKVLIVFTKAGRQFEINAPDTLTPDSASIEPSTRYQSKSIRPLAVGDVLYFVSDGASGSILHEYFFDDNQLSNSASNVTAHVQSLLPASIRSIAASANERTVFVLPEDSKTIYVYRYFWNGNQKQQSAWSKIVLDKHGDLRDIGVVGDMLWITLNGQFLRMPINADPNELTYPDTAVLDSFIVKDSGITGDNPDGTHEYGWTLSGDEIPDNFDSDRVRVLLSSDFGSDAGRTVVPDEVNVTGDPPTSVSIRVTLDTDYGFSGLEAVIGHTYDMSVELTRPYVRDGVGNADIDALVTVRELTAAYNNTGDLTLKATMTNRNDQSKTLSSYPVDSRGTLRGRFNGDAERLRLFIEATNALPCNVSAAEIMVDYAPRRS